MHTRIDVGAALRRCREDQRYTRYFVAGAMGVSYATIRRIEVGQRGIDIPRIMEWLDAIGLDWSDFEDALGIRHADERRG